MGFYYRCEKGRDSKYFSNSAGINIGATPENSYDINVDDSEKPMGHTGEFTADFANKTLTGTLVRNGYVSRSKEQKLQQFTILMQKLKVIAFLVKQTQKYR